jgi:hypothetical protein
MGDQKQNSNDFLDDFIVTVKKPKNEDRPLLPELKRLPATIKQIKKKHFPKSKSVRAHFTFVISSGKYKDQYAWGSVPLHEEVTEKADLYKWMCNILGKESLSIDDDIRLGDLVGRPVEIMVKNTKSGNKTYQNVTEVLTPESVVKEESTEVEEPEENEEESEENSDDLDVGDVDEEEKEEEEISEDDLPF